MCKNEVSCSYNSPCSIIFTWHKVVLFLLNQVLWKFKNKRILENLQLVTKERGLLGSANGEDTS